MAERAAPRDGLLRYGLGAMLAVDVGFVVYWVLVAGRSLPADLMFAEYADPRVAAWNWSFLPLDLVASVTGFLAVASLRSGSGAAPVRLAVSLALTATAGGMAVTYWVLRGQWDPWWLVPNLALLVLPLPLLGRLVRSGTPYGGGRCSVRRPVCSSAPVRDHAAGTLGG